MTGPSRRSFLVMVTAVPLAAAWGCSGPDETIKMPEGPRPVPTSAKVPTPRGKGKGKKADIGGLEVKPRGPGQTMLQDP